MNEREAFEAGYSFTPFLERNKNGTYRHPSTQTAWEGFQLGVEYMTDGLCDRLQRLQEQLNMRRAENDRLLLEIKQIDFKRGQLIAAIIFMTIINAIQFYIWR